MPVTSVDLLLFHNDAEKLLFSDAYNEFGFEVQIDPRRRIRQDFAVNLHGFLLDQALSFRNRGDLSGNRKELGPTFRAKQRYITRLRKIGSRLWPLHEKDEVSAMTLNLQLLNLLGVLAVTKDALEIFGGFACGGLTVEA